MLTNAKKCLAEFLYCSQAQQGLLKGKLPRKKTLCNNAEG